MLFATDPARPLDDVFDEVSWLLDRAGTYRHTRGALQAALPLRSRAHKIRAERLGDDHPDTLVSANNVGLILHALGEYERSRVLAAETLTRQRRVLGDNHASTLFSANNLALDLHALG